MTLTENTVYLLLSVVFLLPTLFVKPEAVWKLRPVARFLVLTSVLTGLGLAGTVLLHCV